MVLPQEEYKKTLNTPKPKTPVVVYVNKSIRGIVRVVCRAVKALITCIDVINYSLAGSKALPTQRAHVMITLVDGLKQAFFVEGVTTLPSS